MSHRVLENWFKDDTSRLTPITVGLLNQTFLVTNSKGRFVLQKLNPLFSPVVNLDIDALTRHIQKKGMTTTRLVPTLSGELWNETDGSCWRMLTFIEGENYSSLRSASQACAAGELVGKLHMALSDFQHDYHFSRPNAHDTSGHLEKLRTALGVYAHHDLASQVNQIAEHLFFAAGSLRQFDHLPKRHSHGDLKINNLLFGKHSQDHSVVDLDTIGLMPWPIELGDAFRSWCNPAGENYEKSLFDENLFEAALSSYAKVAADLWSYDEVHMLIEGIRTIPLELSSRFLRDVLEDCYFGYDAERFASRSVHNLLRSKAQLSVYCDIEKKKAHLERIIKKTFA